ncbi:MAG: hypothetical protein EOP49_05925 [Sphingobacteriales bacterium]|nr:MAG: hypothetical protein EOP49_05925 [Sphingobacteriales bacterium]
MLRKLILIGCSLGIVFTGDAQNRKKKKNTAPGATQTSGIDYKQQGAPLPPVRFFNQDGKYITNKTLDNKANLFLMLFNPTCEHCEEQTILFKDNIHLFKNTKIVLVAGPAMGPYLEYFVNTTKISGFPSIQLTLDSSNYIEQTYHYSSLPQLNIYDADRKLLRTFNGSVPLDTLRQYIQ